MFMADAAWVGIAFVLALVWIALAYLICWLVRDADDQP